MNNVENLRPFKKLCVCVGNLPTAYIESMSYYEALTYMYKYLSNDVVPVVNNNSEVVRELQDYVEHYFDNLDVQEEIDTKLDEMATSGELTEVIGQFLELAGVHAYNNVSEMSSAENLINGSICKTLGATTYLDGNGAYYKIRTKTNEDVIDGVNIIAVYDDSLIAELIPYTKVKPLIDNLNTRVDSIERNAIYLGNSYTTGVGSTGGSTGLFALTKNLFSNAYMFTGSGTGFLAHTDHENDTFIYHLQRAISDTSIDKDSITDIIIIGAYGDPAGLHEISGFATQIETACTNLVNLAKTNYPNLKRIAYVYAEGRAIQNPDMLYPSTLSEEFDIHNLFKFLLPRNNIEYLGWIGFNITLSSSYFSSDDKHPNDLGYAMLSSYFKSAYNGNLTYKPIYKEVDNLDCGITTGSKLNIKAVIEPDKWYLTFKGGSITAGTTSAFNTDDTILDFSSLSWCLPIAFGKNAYFGNSFTVQTTKANENSFDVSEEYLGRLQLVPTTNNLSSKLTCTTFSKARTISSNIGSAIINPSQIYCDLEYK